MAQLINQEQWNRTRREAVDALSIEQLEAICLDYGIELSDLRGETKSAKIVALLSYIKRRNGPKGQADFLDDLSKRIEAAKKSPPPAAAPHPPSEEKKALPSSGFDMRLILIGLVIGVLLTAVIFLLLR